MSVRVKNLQEAIDLFGRKIAVNSMVSTLNRTTRSVRPVMVQAVSDEYNVKPTRVSETIIIRNAKVSDIRSALVSTGRRLKLIDFKGARKTARGVSVEVKKGKRRVLPGTFIQTMPVSEHKGIFERFGPKRIQGRDSRYEGELKQHIRELLGPAIAHLIDEPPVIDKVIRDFKKKAPIEFDRQLRFRIDKAIKKGA